MFVVKPMFVVFSKPLFTNVPALPAPPTSLRGLCGLGRLRGSQGIQGHEGHLVLPSLED
jgi:hypothetical protein